MTKLKTVSGLIAETLHIDGAEVHQHVEGLQAAGRWKGANVGSIETADILCACLNLDSQIATAAFDLPFIGMFVADGAESQLVNHDDAVAGNCQYVPFGGMVAEVLQEAATGRVWETPSVYRSISTISFGREQFGVVVMDGEPVGWPGRSLWFFFGYEFLPVIVDKVFTQQSMMTSRMIGSAAIFELGNHLCGAPVSSLLATSEAERAKAH